MHENNNAESRPLKPERPWCWQNKNVLDRIRSIEGERKISALAVYVALTELASDAASSIFDAHVAAIMEKSGVSDSTARKRIADLTALGVITVKRNYLNSTTALASTFTLLPSRHKKGTPPVFAEPSQKPGNERKERTERKDTGLSPLTPAGFSPEEMACIECWHRLAIPSRLGFLPVTGSTKDLHDALAGYLDLPEFEKIVRWVVDRERNQPTMRSKSLCRVLNDVLAGTGHFADAPYPL